MRFGGWVGGWIAAATLVASSGCGSGGNDQGIVFRAVGTFRGLEQIDEGRITCTEPSVGNSIIDASFTLRIATTLDFPNRNDPFADPCGGYLALENSLSTQSMNVQEILIRYEVPGASIPIPENPVSFGQRILPATSDTETTSGQANLIFAELVGQIVPRTIIVFLNQNVDRLPETPYLMNVFMSARGQSDDGTQYQTNEIGYQLTIIP
jgi:hypothetical protein